MLPTTRTSVNYLDGRGASSLKAGVKKTSTIHAADFETTTDPDDCRVWHWGFAPIDDPDNMAWGTTIESFFEHLSTGNSTTYFHNLGFDGRFIIDHLLRRGFKHTEERTASRNEFTTLISSSNKIFTITIRWANGHRTEFRDSFKKIPMSLARVAKTFNTRETKGVIDYHKPRPIGYEPDADEIEYLRDDVQILAEALATVIGEGMKRLTIGADSMAEYKRTIGTKSYNRYFPVLSHEMDAEIRKALRGGFTYADPRYSKRLVGKGSVYDVNSLYPSVMFNELIPYGEPIFAPGRVETTEDRPLAIVSLTITAKLKKDHIPCIQLKGSSIFQASEYIRSIDEPTTIVATNIDWELYNDHYDIDVLEYGGGWLFHATYGLFDTFINKWSNIKANSEGGRREIAKLIMNNLFGKFTTNPDVTSKVPVMGEDGVVHYVLGDPERRTPVYTAAGVFITSHARNKTVRSAQENYDTFAYADTDSLHLMTQDKPKGITIHPTELGAWKHEYNYQEAMFLVPKRYLEKMDDGSFHVAFAGMPRDVASQFTFDDMVQGRQLVGKNTPKYVRGGVALVPQKFELAW